MNTRLERSDIPMEYQKISGKFQAAFCCNGDQQVYGIDYFDSLQQLYCCGP